MNSEKFYDSIPNVVKDGNDVYFFYFLMLFLALAVFFHFLRMYISLKKLEDPFSTLFRDYIKPLNGKIQIIENGIRLLLILLVTCKAVDKFNEINDFFSYMFWVYFWCLLWDLLIIFCAHKKLKETYFKLNITGVTVCIIYTKLMGQNDTLIPVGLICLLMVVTFWSVVIDCRKNALYLRDIRHLWHDIVFPYFGFKCELERTNMYTPNNNESEHVTKKINCNKPMCQFNKTKIVVLIEKK